MEVISNAGEGDNFLGEEAENALMNNVGRLAEPKSGTEQSKSLIQSEALNGNLTPEPSKSEAAKEIRDDDSPRPGPEQPVDVQNESPSSVDPQIPEKEEQSEPSTERNGKAEPPAEEPSPGPSKVEDEWADILGTGQLKKRVIHKGKPDTRPLRGSLCNISYTVQLEDGTEIERHNRIDIYLGDGEVLQALDLTLALMDVDEEAEIVSSPRFAYGTLGNQPSVPSNATLRFIITLHDAKPEPFIRDLSLSERTKIGIKKKERGNWWCTREDHPQALICYRKALDFFDDTEIPDDHDPDELRILLEERLKTYNNLAFAQLKTGAFDAALMSVGYVLNCQPNNVKALYRKASCLKEKGMIDESIAVLRQGLALGPDRNLQKELSALLAIQREHNMSQRKLYKKMMGNKEQSTAGRETKSKGNEHSSSTRWRWIALGSFAAVLVGMIAVRYKF